MSFGILSVQIVYFFAILKILRLQIVSDSANTLLKLFALKLQETIAYRLLALHILPTSEVGCVFSR